MGIFSRFSKNPNFNLKKSDFKTETDSFYDDESSPPINEEFAKTVAKWKEEKGINEDKELNYDRNSTSAILFGNKVEITYNPSEIELSESDFIIGLNQKLNWISKNKNEINSQIAKKLLPLKNQSWLNDNESIITERDFINRIKLGSILFFGDLSSELVYDDGNLFWGHQIVADLNKKNELTNVDIQG
ncbi:DUF2262 domain-containing protein [Flaviramulus sp. BrNp1-15]|uniref:DUF2262 domain-containing protein n=1 Tax=Flaviramulus sp. BrNp1-15 TaxID=2916754 RepID=UPI001EE782E0|nr:DUF2262 domain-containing protein [Flaviramulus sp. BrNp1-15]ULC60448.1 DUF2262 domain-containing protein [Flaviramulus sp. BrNp1-15]